MKLTHAIGNAPLMSAHVEMLKGVRIYEPCILFCEGQGLYHENNS